MTEVELLYMDLSARTSYGLICVMSIKLMIQV